MREKFLSLKERFVAILSDINTISVYTQENLRTELEYEVYRVLEKGKKKGIVVDFDVQKFVAGLLPEIKEEETFEEEDTVTWIKRAAKAINREQSESSKKPVVSYRLIENSDNYFQSFVDYIGMELGGEVRGISLKQLELQEQEAIKEDLRRENERKREEIRRKIEQQKKEDDERFIQERNQEVRKMMKEIGRDFNFTAEILDELIVKAEESKKSFTNSTFKILVVKKRWDDEMDQQFSAAPETEEEEPGPAEEEETLLEEDEIIKEYETPEEDEEKTEGEDSDSSYEFLTSVTIPVEPEECLVGPFITEDGTIIRPYNL